jgi:hypothetical protein
MPIDDMSRVNSFSGCDVQRGISRAEQALSIDEGIPSAGPLSMGFETKGKLVRSIGGSKYVIAAMCLSDALGAMQIKTAIRIRAVEARGSLLLANYFTSLERGS